MAKSPVKSPKPTPSGPPRALIEHMMTGWFSPKAKPVHPPLPDVDRFQARRKALSAKFPGETLVIPTGHEKIRSNDTAYLFRPGTDFYYLAGNREPDCVLLLTPVKGGHRSVLFVEPEVDRSTHAFFTDRARGAFWVGARLGLDGSLTRYGVDETAPLSEIPARLRALAKSGTPFRVRRGLSGAVDTLLPQRKDRSDADAALKVALERQRMIKSDEEVAAIVRAIQSTKRAYEAVLKKLKTAKNERELEAAFDLVARLEGNGVGFATIVASGANACVMHWTRNDAPIPKGQLVLVDAGVEGKELYTADITRTFPVNGKFNKEQRELYEIVIAAQDAAIQATRPGVDFAAPHRAAVETLMRGCARLGILRIPVDEALRPDRQFDKRWMPHNTSHMLGIDVHDGNALPYRTEKLEAGMVITVEPGLYFQPEDATVPAKYRGIGIRVEEDVLVTPRGARVLSKAIPRTADDIEAWIAELWKA